MPKGSPHARRRYSVEQVLGGARAVGLRTDRLKMQCPVHRGDGLSVSVFEREDGTAGVKCWPYDCKAVEIINVLRPSMGAPEIVASAKASSGCPHRHLKQRPTPVLAYRALELEEAAAQLWFSTALRDRFAEERALTLDVIRRYLIGWTVDWAWRRECRFTIPVFDERNNIISFIGHVPSSMRAPRVRGVDVIAGYSRWPLACLDGEVYRRGDLVLICEAELDALAVRSAGFPA